MRADSNGGHEAHYYPNTARHLPTSGTTAASLNAPGAISAVPNPENSWQVEVQPQGAVLSRGPNSNTEGHPTADFMPGRDFWLSMPEADKAATCQNLAYVRSTGISIAVRYGDRLELTLGCTMLSLCSHVCAFCSSIGGSCMRTARAVECAKCFIR